MSKVVFKVTGHLKNSKIGEKVRNLEGFESAGAVPGLIPALPEPLRRGCPKPAENWRLFCFLLLLSHPFLVFADSVYKARCTFLVWGKQLETTEWSRGSAQTPAEIWDEAPEPGEG